MKALIAFGLFVSPLLALAQFERGQTFLGGSLSGSLATTTYNYNPPSKDVVNQLSVSPSFGYFLNSKIALGAGIGYSTSWQDYESQNSQPQTSSSHNFSISLFARDYIPVTSSFYIALQGQISFSRGTTNPTFIQQTGQVVTYPQYNLGATISPIFIFFPSPGWGIEAGVGSIGYNFQRTLPNVTSTSTFSLNSGTFAFGLAYYFHRKAK